LICDLMQQMCVYLVVAYLLTKTPLFATLMQVTVRLPARLVCYVVFSGFSILGTYLGFQIEGAIANTRAIGAVLGGPLGGPDGGVGCGPHGWFAPLFAGRVFSLGLRRLDRDRRPDRRLPAPLPDAAQAGAAHARPEHRLCHHLCRLAVQMAIILLLARPTEQATRLVAQITVQAYFWQRPWFRALGLLALLAGVAARFRLRTHQLRARQVQMEQLVAQRTEAQTGQRTPGPPVLRRCIDRPGEPALP
jgi:hypothetical protein